VPLTVVSFAAMDLTKETPLFGADTSTGLLPLPGTLVHYAIFFAFGALLFEVPGALAGFSRRWILALVVVVPLLPIAASFAFGAPWTHALLPVPALHRLLAWLGPSLYAWLASIALLGLFARVLPSESRVVRYLSDSSYWLYLAHLPLVVAGQVVLRGVAWPPFAKFVVLTVVSTALLLASYEWCVRRTWIGVLLNGKRG
jgi:peptidoglycan/LPS O-acetylase OafA/YrhL